MATRVWTVSGLKSVVCSWHADRRLSQKIGITYRDVLNIYFPQKGLRKFCAASSALKFECLKSRSLIKLEGPDTASFLQGLITNDVGHFLHHSLPSLFTMFLNQQGRVLYDSILYRISSSSTSETFLVECDTTATSHLIRHLELYKVRKKVEISLDSSQVVWSAFCPSWEDSRDMTPSLQSIRQTLVDNFNPVVITEDPRHVGLGYRMIFPVQLQPKLNSEKELKGSYAELRYKLGIGEGIEDHPSGKCFPLECNVDYLHGISFHKGCYIGQELTARIYHTGVVRKRLMPIRLEIETGDIPENCIIQNEKNENIGRFRKGDGRFGLALLRVSESLASKYLLLKDLNIKITTKKPVWWPVEATKSH